MSASLDAKTAEGVAEWASLLNHPLRVRLITALAGGPGSATKFAAQFGDTNVGDCHYHLKELKAGKVIELARSRPVRGATERVYRLTPRSRSRWEEARRLRGLLDLLLDAD